MSADEAAHGFGAITLLADSVTLSKESAISNVGVEALAVLLKDAMEVRAMQQEAEEANEKSYAKQQYDGANGAGEDDDEAAAKEAAKREADAVVAKTQAKSALDVVRETTDDYMKYPTTDVSNVLIKDDDILTLFKKYDTSGNGFLEREEVVRIYDSFENFGLDDSTTKVDDVLRKYSRRGDGRVNYNEFALLMLNLAQR